MPKLDKAIAHLSRSLNEIAPTHFSYANDVWRKMQVAGHFPVAVQGVLYQPQASSQLWEELSFGQLQTKIAEEHDGKANCFRQEDYFSIAKVVLSIAERPSFFEDAPEGDLDRVDDLARDSTPPQATPDATQAPVDF